jgi:hypothetical protein
MISSRQIAKYPCFADSVQPLGFFLLRIADWLLGMALKFVHLGGEPVDRSKTSTFSPRRTRLEIMVSGKRMMVVPGNRTARSRPSSSSTITHSIFKVLYQGIAENNSKTLQFISLVRFESVALKQCANRAEFAGGGLTVLPRVLIDEKLFHDGALIAQPFLIGCGEGRYFLRGLTRRVHPPCERGGHMRREAW